MELSVENVKDDQFAKLLGIRIMKVERGYALLNMDIANDHLNGMGNVQGGVIFTLADYAFAVAANTDGSKTVAINANISYYNSPKGSLLIAEATEESTKNRLCGYKVKITDNEGTLIAAFQGLGYRTNKG